MRRATKFERLARFWILVAGALAGLCLAGGAMAEDPLVDPPGRVGVLSLFEGAVETWSPGDEDWSDATINLPITTGSAVSTPVRGRVEIWIGSTAIRVAPESQVNFPELNDEGITAEVVVGSARARLRVLESDDRFAFAVGTIRFEARDATDFRVERDPDREVVRLHVYSGRVQIMGADENIMVNGGQQAEVTLRERRILSLDDLKRDDFDDWFDGRERGTAEAEALRYVSPEMTGVEALAGQGYWATDVSYGAIWYPTVVAGGWAPYRYGRWGWIQPWGWTWIDDARWGFVTCHYGRWAFVGGRWGWVPGRRIPRPVWAPALVGYHQGGPGMGWFPLGPGEPYRPTYRGSAGYVRHLNITHVTNSRLIGRPEAFRYANRPEAVTMAPRGVFGGAQHVPQARIVPDPAQLRQLPIAGRPDLPPPPRRAAPQWRGPTPAGATGRTPVGPRPAFQAPDSLRQLNRPMPRPEALDPAAPSARPAQPDFAPGRPVFVPPPARAMPPQREPLANPDFAPANPQFIPNRPQLPGGMSPRLDNRPPRDTPAVVPPQRGVDPRRAGDADHFPPSSGRGIQDRQQFQHRPQPMRPPISPAVIGGDRPGGFRPGPPPGVVPRGEIHEAPQFQRRPEMPQAPRGDFRPPMRGGDARPPRAAPFDRGGDRR